MMGGSAEVVHQCRFAWERKIRIGPKKTPIDGKSFSFRCNLTARIPRSETSLMQWSFHFKYDLSSNRSSPCCWESYILLFHSALWCCVPTLTFLISYLLSFFFFSPPHFMAGNVRVVGQIVGDCILWRISRTMLPGCRQSNKTWSIVIIVIIIVATKMIMMMMMILMMSRTMLPGCNMIMQEKLWPNRMP